MVVDFPAKPDVALASAPLAEVLCQVRFPPILRIAAEQPWKFQEHLRGRFPRLSVDQGFVVAVPQLAGSAAPPVRQPPLHRFEAADHGSTVTLALDFVAVSTTAYTSWAHFIGDLRLAIDALRVVYEPAFSTRLGLRYINKLTLENTHAQSWEEMASILRPDLTHLFRTDAWSASQALLTQVVLDAGNKTLHLSVGYDGTPPSPSCILDFDLFAEGEIATGELVDRATDYHDLIYRAFRWCIREDRLEVFGPRR